MAPALTTTSRSAKASCMCPRQRYSMPAARPLRMINRWTLRVGDQRQIFPTPQISAGGAPALALVNGGRGDRRAVEFRSADIVAGRYAGRAGRGDEAAGQFVG